MDIDALIKCSEELEAAHIEAGKLIRKLRISIGLRHHFGLPMTGTYTFSATNKHPTYGKLVVVNHNGHPIKEVPLRTIPRELWPI
jgi:hypothetical protein